MKKVITEKSGRVRVQTINDKPSKTQQQFKDQVDVNKIIQKYKKTGDKSFLESSKLGVYSDTTMFKDYQSSLNKVIDANNAFGALSSDIRLKFNNDPQQLITYLQNPKNKEESIKLGLRVKRDNSNDAKTPDPITPIPPK